LSIEQWAGRNLAGSCYDKFPLSMQNTPTPPSDEVRPRGVFFPQRGRRDAWAWFQGGSGWLLLSRMGKTSRARQAPRRLKTNSFPLSNRKKCFKALPPFKEESLDRAMGRTAMKGAHAETTLQRWDRFQLRLAAGLEPFSEAWRKMLPGTNLGTASLNYLPRNEGPRWGVVGSRETGNIKVTPASEGRGDTRTCATCCWKCQSVMAVTQKTEFVGFSGKAA